LWEDWEEDVSSYWINLREGEVAGNRKRKYWIVLLKNGFGRSYGPVVRQIFELLNDNIPYSD